MDDKQQQHCRIKRRRVDTRRLKTVRKCLRSIYGACNCDCISIWGQNAQMRCPMILRRIKVCPIIASIINSKSIINFHKCVIGIIVGSQIVNDFLYNFSNVLIKRIAWARWSQKSKEVAFGQKNYFF